MAQSEQTYPKPRVLAAIIFLLALVFLWVGGQLALVGGSLYYVLAGAVLLLVSFFLFRGDAKGSSLYGLLLVATTVWALVEVGLDPWALAPRLAMFAVIGLWFLLPRVRRGLAQAEPVPLLQKPTAMVGTASIVALVVVLFVANLGHEVVPASTFAMGSGAAEPADWSAYGASNKGTRYAAHNQINLDNVATLERAWEFRTGVGGSFKGTPIQVGDGLYLCTGQNVVIALDPDTGAERWRVDPKISTPHLGFWDTCRGVTYHKAPSLPADALCAERLLNATTDARLIAVDVKTGEHCPDFGTNGEISLLSGMGEVKPGFYYVTSPPTIVRDTLVLGGWVVDNQETSEPSGVVRGFNPVTGELRWAWDVGREDRPGLPPAGESYTRGTPNVWSLTSADEELGLIYLPTGNATPDYFGGHRTKAMEKYASSVVALDADTGRVRWHFQTTHHDIWDYDVPSQPTLVDVPVGGVLRKGVIVPTKRGELFFLDRVTGEPIAAVEERATPQSDVPEEWTSPTQPFSVGMPSFAHPLIEESDMWGLTPIDQMSCRLQFKKMRYEGPLTPPSTQGTLHYPGVGGGMNWGSVAVDEVNQLLVVNTLHMPMVVTLYPRAEVTADHRFSIGGPQEGTPYAARSAPFLSPLFAPCLQPPYGEMAVIDLTNQQMVWRRPVGTAAEQGPLGIKSHLPLPMGMFNQAGSAVTGGGLIFIGSVLDSTMRAINIFTGEEVWSDALPASGKATPMTYVSPKTGVQYVVQPVADEEGFDIDAETSVDDTVVEPGSSGGYVIAYRLPNQKVNP